MSASSQRDPARMHLRIARPVSDLKRAVTMYRHGLGLHELGRFEQHAGFDGVILGWPGVDYHLEFTFCRTHPIGPTPTDEDLLVFYAPDHGPWTAQCARMVEAGFVEVPPFNPYWRARGRTFQDRDGYKVVLEQSAWCSRRQGS